MDTSSRSQRIVNALQRSINEIFSNPNQPHVPLEPSAVSGFSLLSGVTNSHEMMGPLNDMMNLTQSQADFAWNPPQFDVKLDSPAKRWLSSFLREDPRWQIKAFFLLAAQQGAIIDEIVAPDSLLKAFSKASVFTVWRPCSVDAIQKMIRGEAVGKGLEIKGKSAKKGQLSGFVPYLQIHDESDKRRVGTLRADGSTRIFYRHQANRDAVVDLLKPQLKDMIHSVKKARRTLKKTGFSNALNPDGDNDDDNSDDDDDDDDDNSNDCDHHKRKKKKLLKNKKKKERMKSIKLGKRGLADQIQAMGDDSMNSNNNQDQGGKSKSKKGGRVRWRKKLTAEEVDAKQEDALEKMMWNMEKEMASIQIIDKYAPQCYGVEVPSRLLWKVMVTEQLVERTGDLQTGRPSEPFFQDMNHKAIFTSNFERKDDDNNNNPKEKKKHKAKQKDSNNSSRNLQQDDTTVEEEEEDDDERPRVVLWQTWSPADNNEGILQDVKDKKKRDKKKKKERKKKNRHDESTQFSADNSARSGADDTNNTDNNNNNNNNDDDSAEPVNAKPPPPNPYLDPRTLVMAYEEAGRVLPVVSDFDCFLMGTRGVRYPKKLPADQEELLQWCVACTEQALELQYESYKNVGKTNPETSKNGEDDKIDLPQSWTSRWLEILKKSADKGFHPTIPRFGFGDKKSYEMMKGAVGRSVQVNGAVRHGAECFNYYFPQELDEEFLVMSDMLPGGLPFQYMNVGQLQYFLSGAIQEGYTFPLNPKWILCDPGWKHIYDQLLASRHDHVQDSLNIWFPPDSGVREKFDIVCNKYREGYVFVGDREDCGTEAMDLATAQLHRYMVLKRAKMKLRAVLFFNKLRQGRPMLAAAAKEAEDAGENEDESNNNAHVINNFDQSLASSTDGLFYHDSRENNDDDHTDFYSAKDSDDDDGDAMTLGPKYKRKKWWKLGLARSKTN